mmetsp:Transcript_119289/g.237784  ORF Transcript_119289/g.237784 Transcript_119289/m.237784 type:complete len:274 (+) Transcript_119289:191-1012(+)
MRPCCCTTGTSIFTSHVHASHLHISAIAPRHLPVHAFVDVNLLHLLHLFDQQSLSLRHFLWGSLDAGKLLPLWRSLVKVSRLHKGYLTTRLVLHLPKVAPAWAYCLPNELLRHIEQPNFPLHALGPPHLSQVVGDELFGQCNVACNGDGCERLALRMRHLHLRHRSLANCSDCCSTLSDQGARLVGRNCEHLERWPSRPQSSCCRHTSWHMHAGRQPRWHWHRRWPGRGLLWRWLRSRYRSSRSGGAGGALLIPLAPFSRSVVATAITACAVL